MPSYSFMARKEGSMGIIKKRCLKIMLLALLSCMSAFAVTAYAEEPDQEASAVYHVWFDGTIGVQQLLDNSGDSSTYHPGMSSYYAGAADTHVEVTDGKLVLPSEAGATQNYEYELNGWYDIYNQTYYGKEYFGTEITISRDTVFYADWKALSYSLGEDSGRAKVTNQPDTSGFITTDVFDYNELFNLRSVENDESDSRTKLNATSHAELWRLAQNGDSSLGFTFLNWAYNELTKNRTLGSVGDRDAKNESLSEITQNIISGSDGSVTESGRAILDALFTKSTELGRYYLGEGDGLYQYVSDKNDKNYGYYYYDSKKNGASYNQAAQSFVLYEDPEYILEQKLVGNAWQYKGTETTTGFLPFNDDDSGSYNEKDGTINYWFGIQSSIDFWLPNEPGTGGNIADSGKEMEFRFSGDDDVWVFVDDTLVLDLGGIHGARGGSVNFSTGKVLTETSKDSYAETDLPDAIGSGNHKLTIYYLERGSSQSNCSIYFNIAPKYALSIVKKDAEDEAVLQDARFGIYSDKACTSPAELWNDISESGDSTNEFVTGSDGVATAYGMAAGNTYYVKELQAPEGYELGIDEPICIAIDKSGKATASDGANFTVDESDKRYYLTVTNPKSDEPDEPDEPDQPDEPDEPDNPDEPDEPGEPTDDEPTDDEPNDDEPTETAKVAHEEAGSLPDTGDNAWYAMIACLMLSGTAIATLAFVRKSKVK